MLCNRERDVPFLREPNADPLLLHPLLALPPAADSTFSIPRKSRLSARQPRARGGHCGRAHLRAQEFCVLCRVSSFGRPGPASCVLGTPFAAALASAPPQSPDCSATLPVGASSGRLAGSAANRCSALLAHHDAISEWRLPVSPCPFPRIASRGHARVEREWRGGV